MSSIARNSSSLRSHHSRRARTFSSSSSSVSRSPKKIFSSASSRISNSWWPRSVNHSWSTRSPAGVSRYAVRFTPAPGSLRRLDQPRGGQPLQLRIDLAVAGAPEEPRRDLDLLLDVVPGPAAEPEHSEDDAARG